MLLRLPYTYTAHLLPARCKIARERTVRDYVLADVREVGRYELEPAIEIDDPDPKIPTETLIVSPEGRLMAPARHRVTGEPLKPDAFQRIHADDVDATADFDPAGFPYEGMRHGKRSIGPMEARTRAGHLRVEGWRSVKEVGGDGADRFLQSAAYLSEAVIIVEDVVYLECREPVWTLIDPHGADRRLRLERDPSRLSPHRLFRLDRNGDVQAWARRLGLRLPPLQTVRILRPEVLTRDDRQEIARSCRPDLLSVWIWTLGHLAERDLPEALFERISLGWSRDGAETRAQAIVFLSDFAAAFRALVPEPGAEWQHGRLGRVRSLIDRWDYETELGLDLDPAPGVPDLAQEDIDALAGL